jgi:RNA polymerase primary sigma factor
MMQTTEALYFRDIGRYKILSDEEERVLVKAVQDNVEGSVNKLITSNLRFVVSIAKRYRGRGLSYLELINEGNLGLLKAAKRFKLDMKVKFISYAVWWIRQSIQKALFDQPGLVRIPSNKITLISKFKKALEHNSGDYDETFSQKEFKKHEQEILEIIDKMHDVSLDAPLSLHSSCNDENSKTLQDIVGEAGVEHEERENKDAKKIVDGLLQTVTSREERILRMYYGINFPRQFTLEEIGKELNLTRERVRLIRDRSLKKLLKNPQSRTQLTILINSTVT